MLDVIPQTIFREYQSSPGQRSDRSANDRKRHREKVKQSIKDNIIDIIADESIIGKSGDKIIKVPIQGIKEYRFVYGDNEKGTATGDGNAEPGQVVGKTGDGQGPGKGKGKAGNQKGDDIYEVEIQLDEVLAHLFEELQLPFLKKSNIKEIIEKSKLKKDGYRKVGIPVRLDRFKTARARVKRLKATQRHGIEQEECPDCIFLENYQNVSLRDGILTTLCETCSGTGRVDKRMRFRNEDRVYKHMDVDPKPQSNAAIIFVMDVSGSMDQSKKFLARSFFFLLYSFIKEKYERSEVVFISHTTEAQEVDEDIFFHSGESGGTILSSGLEKAIDIIKSRYNPSVWSNYVFHMTDGENMSSDNEKTVKANLELCKLCSIVGYGEIKPEGSNYWGDSSMMDLYKKDIKETNFRQLKIADKTDIWPKLKEFLRISDEDVIAT